MFDDISKAATYPADDPYENAVQYQAGNAEYDVIFVQARKSSFNTDTVSMDALKQAVDHQLHALVTGGQAKSASDSEVTHVAGNRALRTQIVFANGDGKEYDEIYAGEYIIDISCQYRNNKTPISKGCTAVKGTMKINGG